MTRAPPAVRLSGGVVAYNEERGIRAAVRSLLVQELPANARWTAITVLASGCTDRTEEVVRQAFAADPRVRLWTEPERRGKAEAVNRLLGHADGDWFVLLDGDCRAAPGAVGALLESARTARGPLVAVGSRHLPPQTPSRIARSSDLLWGILHRLALNAPPGEAPLYLLDSLALLPVGRLAPVPANSVNSDGIRAHQVLRAGGALVYASGAGVEISVPATFRSYVAQRGRIRAGDRQLAEAIGRREPGLRALARERPALAARLVLAEARDRRASVGTFGTLFAGEVAAEVISWIRTGAGSGDGARWPKVAAFPPSGASTAGAETPPPGSRATADPVRTGGVFDRS
jgi:hypothetical protein